MWIVSYVCIIFFFLIRFFFPSHFYMAENPGILFKGVLKIILPLSLPSTFWLVPTLKSWRYFLIQTGVLALFSSEWFISQLWFILMANISHNRKTKSNKVTILAFTKYQIPSLLSSLSRGTWQLQRLGFPNPYQRVCFGLLNLGKRLSV